MSGPRYEPAGATLSILDPITRTQRSVIGDLGAVTSGPAWSPDGAWIEYRSEAGMFVIHPDGTGETRIADPGFDADWSPDSTWLHFYRFEQSSRSELWIAPVDGASERLLGQFAGGQW